MGLSSRSPIDLTDPFFEILRPPPDETPAQTTARLKRELDAQRVSDEIDEEIQRAMISAKSQKNVIKVLLLGQSESGVCPIPCIGHFLNFTRQIDNPEECVERCRSLFPHFFRLSHEVRSS
jgi:hypothetical protein